MRQKHTHEPWRANDAQADIDGPNGEAVAVCYCNDDDGSDAIANARRIVACVNACAGISTDALERSKSLEDFMRSMKVIEQQRDELNRLCEFNQRTSDKLLKQRDELLAALIAAAPWAPHGSAVKRLLDDALERMKGGAA